jgi:hypothetical protein
MAGTVKEVEIDSPTAREGLKPGRQPHWNVLRAGHSHLGWLRRPDERAGRWILRRRINGRYSSTTIGIADDHRPADGITILNYKTARQRGIELASGVYNFLGWIPAKPTKHRAVNASEHIDTKLAVNAVREFATWETPPDIDMSVVYFVLIGQAIKIGFTTKLRERLKWLQKASAAKIELIAAIPGDRELEQQFHRELSSARITGEFFQAEAVIKFLTIVPKRLKWLRGRRQDHNSSASPPLSKEEVAEQQRVIRDLSARRRKLRNTDFDGT